MEQMMEIVTEFEYTPQHFYIYQLIFFFFFQAEDGIRDHCVTGVQTCALPISTLLNGFKPLFKALTPADVNKLSYEIIQTLQGEGGTVNSLLAHTASLTTAIEIGRASCRERV